MRIQVLPEDSAAELERITQSLATAELITPPPCRSDVEPVSEDAWRELTEKLKATLGKPLSRAIAPLIAYDCASSLDSNLYLRYQV